MTDTTNVAQYPAAAGGGGAGTVSYVSASEGNSGATDSTVCNMPANDNDGNFEIALLLADAETTHTPPTGWTAIGTSIVSSSSIMFASYRIASSEPASYTFKTGVATGTVVLILNFSKDSGTWAIADDSTSAVTNAEITTGSVDISANGALICAYGCDAALSISSAPSDMTEGEVFTTSSIRMYAYYQEYSGSASNVTKTATWGSSEDMTSWAIVLEAQ